MNPLLAVAFTALAFAATTPSGVELELLIDTTSPLPGSSDVWHLDGPAPAPCGEGVVFQAVKASSSPMSLAYYVDERGVQVVVDENSVVGGTSIGFDSVSSFRCAEPGRYVFVGVEAPPSSRPASIYEWPVGGQIRLVQSGGVSVDGRQLDDLVQLGANPLGIGVLAGLEGPSSTEALAAKLFHEEPILVADEDVILPGQSTPVSALTAPRPQGKELLFYGRTILATGLYRWSPTDGISVLVDGATEVPGFPGKFASVGGFTILAEGVAFAAQFSGGNGIFLLSNDGAIEPLVVPGQVTAEGEAILSAVNPDGAGGLFTFTGTTAETTPIPPVFIFTPTGEVQRVLGVTEMLQGESVVFVDAGAHSQSVAVRVETLVDLEAPLRGAIYRLTFGESVTAIPALTTAGLAVLVALLLLAARPLLRRVPSRR